MTALEHRLNEEKLEEIIADTVSKLMSISSETMYGSGIRKYFHKMEQMYAKEMRESRKIRHDRAMYYSWLSSKIGDGSL